MVCSCAMSFNCFGLQILFCSCVNETMLSPSCDRSCVKMADCFASWRYSLKNKLSDRMIKQLLNSVIAKYRDLSVSHSVSASGNNWSSRHRQPNHDILLNLVQRSLFSYLEKSFITIIHTWLWLNWITLCIIKQHKIVMPFHKTLELKKYNSGF